MRHARIPRLLSLATVVQFASLALLWAPQNVAARGDGASAAVPVVEMEVLSDARITPSKHSLDELERAARDEERARLTPTHEEPAVGRVDGRDTRLYHTWTDA
jgi:hypothetical protein